ncbi:ABC transporter permease [Paenibacillus contaminans]|uniref:ABC transporter permease n=1 Tax=Paenibacillus contaminans TaxID=450362 RepID=A0A329MK44_9BACL|nr:ABC transporter permease [Paenibacillus contaminans]RAV20219.1 ABC transporter permease [Paenibacillus contaminans]
MKFRQLAAKNVRGNWHQYSAFFLSSVFSVAIFYIYAAFIFHPDVVNGHIEAASKVRQGMILCEYIIMIFSFFFVLYSMSAFVKSRKKEFGLFSLFGMTSGQIRRMVLYENIVISLLAIVTGIAFGALFSKLFFMALAELLDVSNPIRFTLPAKALLLTGVGFFVLFLVITLFTLFQIGRSQIIDLLKASKKPKTPPIASKWLVLLSIVCIGAGYYMAYNMNMMNVMIYMLPILFLVVVGTYFLFTQASVSIFRRLQRRTPFYYKGTNLMTVSQLVFKIKDNARILFMVSIMSAVILTASGTFYVFFQGSKAQLLDNFPQTIAFFERGLNTHNVVDPEKVRQILKEDGVQVEYELKLAGITAAFPIVGSRYSKETNALIVPESDYNKYAALMKRQREKLDIANGHAVYVYPYKEMKMQLVETGVPLKMKANESELELTIDKQVNGAIAFPRFEATELLVVDDEQYKAIMQGVPEDKQVAVYGFELQKWESAGETAAKIAALVPEKQNHFFENRVASYKETMQLASLTLFIGLFVSFLFFIASGSMIYFKLFTELEEDREQFRALTRIGMTKQEISKTVTTQIAIVFYVPCVVGIVHTMFAMKALGNLLFTSAMLYALVVIGIYIVMQSVYFLAARRSYLNKIVKGYAD